MPDELIAYCGLYCGACSFKVGFEERNKEHIMRMPSIYDDFKSRPLEFCPGCRLENLCGDCGIRECAQVKKIEYCSLCNEFPCEKLLEFSNDGKPHHAESIDNLILIKDMGKEKWLETQKQQWSCEKCNSKFSWYMKECEGCNG